MTVQFHHGVTRNDPDKARLYFRMFRKAAVAPPASADYSGFYPIGMLGNDQYGDCVEAANGHIVEQQTYYGQGVEFPLTTQQVLNEYSRITGFNPSDPNTDQGTMIQDGLNDLRKTGFNGHTIAAFAQVNTKNLDEVRAAVAEFGAVSIGLPFPQSAMSQFNSGQPWTVVNGSPIEGGHCVLVVGYNADHLTVITWGAVQKMGYDFWSTYLAGSPDGEAWAVIDKEWVNNATGLDPEGIDLNAFGAQFAALTGEPNPFPDAPAPVPAPVPTPVPAPAGPDAAEAALVAAGNKYESSFAPRKYLVTAFDNWKRDKGFA